MENVNLKLFSRFLIVTISAVFILIGIVGCEDNDPDPNCVEYCDSGVILDGSFVSTDIFRKLQYINFDLPGASSISIATGGSDIISGGNATANSLSTSLILRPCMWHVDPANRKKWLKKYVRHIYQTYEKLFPKTKV